MSRTDHPRAEREPAPAPNAGARAIWARLTVDPLAVPLARTIARWPGVTPNRVTLFSGVLAVVAAVCFATGHLRVGGLFFIVRYFVDCVDGQVARFQGTSSKTGAALDISVDVVGIAAAVGALSWFLIGRHELALASALALLSVLVVYNWSLAYRKLQAATLGVAGDGGNAGRVTTRVPGLGGWIRLCQRIGMSPVPWSVEAEIVALGLGPLLAPQPWVRYGLWLALAFYAVATVVNLLRIRRFTRAIDERTAAGATPGERTQDV